MANNNQCDDQFLRELLEERGYYRKWNAEVMTDILLPHVRDNNRPDENGALTTFKQDCNNINALYLVKEFMHSMGMLSSEKIFDVEAGLEGKECEYNNALATKFPLLQQSCADNIQPPLLAQIVYLWRLDYMNRKQQMNQSACSNTCSNNNC